MKIAFLSIMIILFTACSTNSIEKNYAKLKSQNINLLQYETLIIKGKEYSNTDQLYEKLKLIVKLSSHIPTNKVFHTFLLDGNNHVVMIGNPLYNSETETLFKTTVEKLLSKSKI